MSVSHDDRWSKIKYKYNETLSRSYTYSTEAVVCRCSSKQSVLKNNASFTGKHLCCRLLQHKSFPVKFARYF